MSFSLTHLQTSMGGWLSVVLSCYSEVQWGPLVAFKHLYPIANVLQDLNEWLQVLQQIANEREAIVQRMVRQANLSQELSDLVVYCQPVPFDIESKFLLSNGSPILKWSLVSLGLVFFSYLQHAILNFIAPNPWYVEQNITCQGYTCSVFWPFFAMEFLVELNVTLTGLFSTGTQLLFPVLLFWVVLCCVALCCNLLSGP